MCPGLGRAHASRLAGGVFTLVRRFGEGRWGLARHDEVRRGMARRVV